MNKPGMLRLKYFLFEELLMKGEKTFLWNFLKIFFSPNFFKIFFLTESENLVFLIFSFVWNFTNKLWGKKLSIVLLLGKSLMINHKTQRKTTWFLKNMKEKKCLSDLSGCFQSQIPDFEASPNFSSTQFLTLK